MSILTDQELRSVLGKEVVIYPQGDEKCFSSKGYDLRVGFMLPLNKEPPAIDASSPGNVFSIPPKTTAFIITKEFVWLSKKLVGTFHIRGKLAAHGLIATSTTIDSGWHFQLLFLVYNASEQPVKLTAGEPFLTMMLHRVAVPSNKPAPESFIHTVRERASIYGEAYLTKLYDHLFDAEEQRNHEVFDEQVRKAQNLSLAAHFWFNLRTFLGGDKGSFSGRVGKVLTVLLWVITLGMLAVGFTLQWDWSWLQTLFRFNNPYNGPTIIPTQIVAILTAVGIVLVLRNSNKK